MIFHESSQELVIEPDREGRGKLHGIPGMNGAPEGPSSVVPEWGRAMTMEKPVPGHGKQNECQNTR